MALDLENLKRETLATCETDPRYHTYSTQDTVADVKTSGYFNGSTLRLSDMIIAQCNNTRTTLQVVSLNPVVVAELSVV